MIAVDAGGHVLLKKAGVGKNAGGVDVADRKHSLWQTRQWGREAGVHVLPELAGRTAPGRETPRPTR